LVAEEFGEEKSTPKSAPLTPKGAAPRLKESATFQLALILLFGAGCGAVLTI